MPFHPRPSSDWTIGEWHARHDRTNISALCPYGSRARELKAMLPALRSARAPKDWISMYLEMTPLVVATVMCLLCWTAASVAVKLQWRKG
jgi:hypothetical protein